MLLTSPLLERLPRVRHGFSTRQGGVSAAPYDTLNLARGDDDLAHVGENIARFCAGLGLEGLDPIVQVDQVHGDVILDAEHARGQRADGIVSTTPGVAVGVRTADCAPVLVAAVDLRMQPIAVAAVHAGWRGATQRIVARAIEALEERGAERKRMFFAIGPTIGMPHFEVGDEVIAAAAESLGGETPPSALGPRGKPHLDLVQLLVRQLEQLGIDDIHIDRAGACTFADQQRFYSYRRDGGVTGRHLSAIYFEANA